MRGATGRRSADRTILSYEAGNSGETGAERELIEQARSDPQAFGRLYEANYTRILNYIYGRTLNVDVAEALTSNTFFRALRGLPGYRRRAPFRAWLYRIATNEIKTHRRSQRRRRAAEQAPRWQEELQRIYFSASEIETKEEHEEKMQQYSRLHQSLAALPERYQTVLVLRYFEDLSYSDIGKALGKRIGTVKSLIHRGLKRLKRLI